MRALLILALLLPAKAAIQFDTSDGTCRSSSASITCSYTMGSAANGAIIVNTWVTGTQPNYVQAVTWDVATANQAFTKLTSFTFTDGGLGLTGTVSVWYLGGPTTSGAKLITVTTPSSLNLDIVIRSYTGVNQTGQPEANSGNLTPTCGNSNCSATVTTVANNAWLVTTLGNLSQRPIQCNQTGDNCSNPQSNTAASDFRANSADRGPITPAGSSTIVANAGGAGDSVMALYAFSLAPAVVKPVKHEAVIQ